MASTKRSWILQEFSAHNVGLSSAALGKKSGRVMATGSEDGQVNLWAVGNPSCIMKFTGYSSAIEALTFNSSEELVCAGSRSGQLRIWNISEGKVTRNLTGHKAAVTCLDFHSIGEFVASGSLDNNVKMWDYRRKGCIFTYAGHEAAINALQFSPDGRWMTSASDDGLCKIWDLSAGKLLRQFGDHAAPVTCLQFHPNELLLATGGKDKTVKVYDVEQFQLVSSSKVQSSTILKVVFSESGHCVYSVSQDMCHAYLWEPEPRNTDALIVKWGRPMDVVISAKQLISATITQNKVSNYIVDLAKVKTSAYELPNTVLPFEPPATVAPFSRPSNITMRSSASSRTATPREPPNARKPDDNPQSAGQKAAQSNYGKNVHLQGELTNNRDAMGFEDALPLYSPSVKRPTSILTTNHEPRVQTFKPAPTTPHQGTNILPHLTPDSVTPSSKSVRDPPERDSAQRASLSSKVPPGSTPGGEGMGFLAEDVPTRDQPILWNRKDKHPGDDNLAPPASRYQNSLEESTLSAIAPAQREGAIGLDMNAFLPAKKEPEFCKENEQMSDSKATDTIKQGFESMRIVLAARRKNLDIVRAMWTSGDVMTAMNTAIRMKDQALLMDLFSVLNIRKSLWNLDLCQVMLPEILDLITSKYESYVATACAALKVVVQNFGQVIKSNVSAPPSSAVDLSREERYRKCYACNDSIIQIRTVIEKRVQTPGKVGTNFRELNLLISSTFD